MQNTQSSETTEPHTFGTHEFVELCRRLGAEPYICHNGHVNLEEMKSRVEYCNGTEGEFASMRKRNGYPEPLNVKFWSVTASKTLKGSSRKRGSCLSKKEWSDCRPTV